MYGWQQPELDETYTVTMHIKALREKLQDPVKNPCFIQTVWGKKGLTLYRWVVIIVKIYF